MTDKETRRKIVIEYGAGATVTALSEKYKLSRTTISKILGSVKTEQKLSNNCSKTERVGVAIGRVKEIDEQDNKELARKTVNAIMSSLPNDIKRASIADKMKVLERMVELFGFNKEDEQEEVRLIVTSEDASGGSDEDANA